MGVKERRDTEKKQMKKKIIDAAITLIEQEGYEKLSIRKIAATIEYSPTTIYLYYKDKAEIITDMSDILYRNITDKITAAMNHDFPLAADQQVHQLMCIFINELCHEPEMVKAIMYSGVNVIFANENTNGKPDNEGISILDNIITDGINQGIFRQSAKETAWMLVSALIGFVMSTIGNQLHLHDDFDQFTSSFADILTGGITQ